MGWIEKRTRICHCPLPDDEIRAGQVGEGSTWQCDRCRKTYRVICHQLDGWMFVSVNEKEQEQQ